MGQKINPVGLRLGINRTWDSRWFADGPEYGRLLHEGAAERNREAYPKQPEIAVAKGGKHGQLILSDGVRPPGVRPGRR